jgi:hypothetical protein
MLSSNKKTHLAKNGAQGFLFSKLVFFVSRPAAPLYHEK